MLRDQRSRYVGRFARGWPRLPGERPPGNHRPGRGPRRGYAGSCTPRKRVRSAMEHTGCRDDVHVTGTRRDERVGTRGHRRARGEDVVDEQHAGRHRTSPHGERAVHRASALLTTTPCLRPRGHTPDQELRHRAIEPAAERDGQRARLVVAALGQPSACERDPRHDVGVRQLVARRDRGGKGARHVTPPRELQPVHGSPGWTLVQEGCARARHRRGRAFAARRNRDR
jgi:hypothetical protein